MQVTEMLEIRMFVLLKVLVLMVVGAVTIMTVAVVILGAVLMMTVMVSC